MLVIDRTWVGLTQVRKHGLNGYVGDILTEQLDYQLDLTPYRFMLAMAKNDTYNAHVCEDFAPDLGRDHLYQTAFHLGNENVSVAVPSGKRLFTPAVSINDLVDRMNTDHVIRKKAITKQYSYTQYLRERDDKSVLLYILRVDNSIEFYTPKIELQAQAGDLVVSLTSPAKTIERVKEKLDEKNGESEIPIEKLEELFREC